MNIILIQTDQQRQDSLPCYGNSLIKTPCLDALAEKGTVFSHSTHLSFTTSEFCTFGVFLISFAFRKKRFILQRVSPKSAVGPTPLRNVS